MISAKEALDLSGLGKLEPTLLRIEEEIKRAAAEGKMETVYRYNSDEGLDMYPPEYKRNPLTRKVVAELRDKGFKVEMYYKECSIAVDIGISISWEPKR